MNERSDPRRVLLALARDTAMVLVGLFMLLHETLALSPRIQVLAVGVLLLLGPAAIRTIIEGWLTRGSSLVPSPQSTPPASGSESQSSQSSS